ncbi:hypothetical protein HRbin31_00118 [bacterium HR31]|nr:hypothetical protein HRbin31_00118 [bacterium HR31]
MAAVAADELAARTQAVKLLRRLADCQDRTGNLRDPLNGEPLAPSHYAVCLFAGACAMSGEGDLREPAERAVRYFLGLPARVRGAAELNNLGLLAAYRGGSRRTLSDELERRLNGYLLRMPFTSLTGRGTNNWHAMRAVCLLQRGLALGRAADVEAARRCMQHEVLPLQGGSGLFADYPPRGSAGDRCTPLTYHAKFCAMLAMFLSDLPDAQVQEALRRGVIALTYLCAPDGETLYFGRSCNSLYGYAATLYALRRSLEQAVVGGEQATRAAAAASRVAGFLGHLLWADGASRTYPTPFERERLGWDDYVNRLDYAAFAAYLLVQTPEGPPVRWGVEPVRWGTEEAGLWVERDGDRFAAFSTRGQFHPGSYLFADARYSGLQVLSWKHGGRTVVPPPPHEMSDPTEPRWVGFMPVVEAAGVPWAVRQYGEVRSFPSSKGVAFAGRGLPVHLWKTAAHQLARTGEQGTWLGLAMRGARLAAQRLGFRAPIAYRRAVLRGAEVDRAFVWFRDEGCLVCTDRFRGEADAVWATVRLAVPPLPYEDRLRFDCRGLQGELRFLHGVSAPPEVEEAFTSNGLAYVVRYALRHDTAAVTALAVSDVETSCEASSHGLVIRVGGCAAVVDLDRLEVWW